MTETLGPGTGTALPDLGPSPGDPGLLHRGEPPGGGAPVHGHRLRLLPPGGLLAVLIRLQVSLPLLGVLSPEAYNQAFTMHGSTMMFLFVLPFVEGLAIYLVPLMIGAREMAFPRLNAFGYWVFLMAGLSLYAAYLFGYAPDSGWYNYPPSRGGDSAPGRTSTSG
jgi:heme/copper-type cytochrome/quinol oxidase subunit 1